VSCAVTWRDDGEGAEKVTLTIGTEVAKGSTVKVPSCCGDTSCHMPGVVLGICRAAFVGVTGLFVPVPTIVRRPSA
jgi:hypothetical protein